MKINNLIKQKDKILLIDLSNLFYFSKPFHLNESLLQGHYSVVEQFIINLNSYIRKFNPTSVILADDEFPIWRKKIYPIYKEHRNKKEFTELDTIYNKNKEKLRELLKSNILPIYYLRSEQLEADDICYLVCEQIRNKEILVMSGDEDLVQISQKYSNVNIYSPNKRKIIEPSELNVVRYKILKGCSSDNIKGFPGIGDSKAKEILKTKKTFNFWYKNLSEEQLELYSSLKNIICLDRIPNEYRIKLYEQFNTYTFKEYDSELVRKIIKEYKFDRINIDYIDENFSNLKKIK